MGLDLDTLPVVRAAHDSGPRGTTPTMICVHTAETDEGSTAAEGVAAFFAVDSPGRGSAQLTVDDDSAVRCVPDDVIPWAAGEGDANQVGLHVEICGRAGQTAGEWDDDYSKATLAHTADLVRQWVARFPHIRVERITADRLALGERNGICGHADYHEAFPGGAVRTDPGAEFPWARFLALVSGTPDQEDPDVYYLSCLETGQLLAVSEFRVAGYPLPPDGHPLRVQAIPCTTAERDTEITERQKLVAALSPKAGTAGDVTVAIDAETIAAGITAGIKAL